jgi:brefeldin A-inhibited guanine nucleotide-exchange protein
VAAGPPRLAEPALACLHKVVAYAYLQGESRPSGRSDDAANPVVAAVALAARAGGSPSPEVQLALVRALLTIATAEHFQAHGDCLMQAVRCVFNVAVSGATPDARATARSALLQMLNTVLRRVAQQVVSARPRSSTSGSSPAVPRGTHQCGRAVPCCMRLSAGRGPSVSRPAARALNPKP